MEIKGKIHCLFEQSGTFKNEFKKLGYDAYDYDIQNNFGETDNVIDLFSEIDRGYRGEVSLFDTITQDDLIMSFFPCIYFCEMSALRMTFDSIDYRNLSIKEKTDRILERADNRNTFYKLIIQLVSLCLIRGLRMVFENPYSKHHYLLQVENFIIKPSYIDYDRTIRGDYFKKPTMYYFVGCEPTEGCTITKNPHPKNVWKCKSSPLGGGICSEERSMIAPLYAHNFIMDKILGKSQRFTQLNLFDNEGI